MILYHRKRGFTLIELLVVIAILAILMMVVLITVNPIELLRQSRDTNRLSDMASIQSAINLYAVDNPSGSLGNSSTTYISISDPAATSTTGTQCQGLGFPSSTYSFFCPASSTVRLANSTGWIPINFSLISSGNPFGQLPTDPINQTSSGIFYTYTTNGTQYETTALMESQKYRTQISQNATMPLYPGVVTNGTNLSLSGLYSQNGLVGYWNFDEGNGNNAYDSSGNNATMTWSGAQWSAGKVGSLAGRFSGSNFTTGPAAGIGYGFSQISISAWVNPTNASGTIIYQNHAGSDYLWRMELYNGNLFCELYTNNGTSARSVATLTMGTYSMTTCTYDGTRLRTYINAVPDASSTATSVLANDPRTPFVIGGNAYSGSFVGSIDDVRIYNRALSTAEIQALYNSEK